MKSRLQWSVLLALLAAMPAQAHYLWLEPDGDATRLCFGEYEHALRERSGGRLDGIALPEAQTNPADGRRTAVAIRREADHLALDAAAGRPLIAQEITMPVKDLRKHHLGIVKPMYYARYAADAAEGASPLALDIQPLGQGRVRVSLHGAPLAKARLSVYAPNRWLREYETDAAGEAAVDTPWPGLYVVEVAHVEARPGEYRGEAYEGLRHVGTLSFIR